MADTPAPSAPMRQPGPLMRPSEGRVKAPPRVADGAPPAAGAEPVQPKHMGNDWTRPFRYSWAFVKGTLYDTFDKAAHLGHAGFYIGMAVGVLSFFATGGVAGIGAFGALVMNVLWNGVLGAGIGMAAGGVLGAVTGGMRGWSRASRKEKYADELATREDERETAAPRGFSYRDVMARNDVATNYNYDRAQQIARENQRDDSTFWRDRVDNERSFHHHREQGF